MLIREGGTVGGAAGEGDLFVYYSEGVLEVLVGGEALVYDCEVVDEQSQHWEEER